jgi:hypothetical protein
MWTLYLYFLLPRNHLSRELSADSPKPGGNPAFLHTVL